MKVFFLIAMVLLVLHDTHSYILFTANMEDVNALAKQLATSPVVDQINRIWRRAANQFRKEIQRDGRRRSGSDDDGEQETKKIVKNIVEFGKNLGYLGPMKRAFEYIEPK